jgi:Phage integrase, N-terminal SAM-like domain
MGVKVREWDGGKGGKLAWWIFVDHKNKRKAKKIGAGPEAKKRAKEPARVIEARLAMGDLGIIEPTQPVMLQDYVKNWLEDHVAINMKGGTHRIYSGIIKNHWLPALGSKPLPEITRAEIRQVITGKMRQGMSRTTAGHRLTALQSCLTIAEGELIPKTPFRNHSTWLLKAKKHRIDPSKIEIFTSTAVKSVSQTQVKRLSRSKRSAVVNCNHL